MFLALYAEAIHKGSQNSPNQNFIHAPWRGRSQKIVFTLYYVHCYPLKMAANLRIPDDSAMLAFSMWGIFFCLFVGHEGIRDFLRSWPKLVHFIMGLFVEILLHPGKWTAGTQEWRFGSDDVPDFNCAHKNSVGGCNHPIFKICKLFNLDPLPRYTGEKKHLSCHHLYS